jgi:hypothetical protein
MFGFIPPFAAYFYALFMAFRLGILPTGGGSLSQPSAPPPSLEDQLAAANAQINQLNHQIQQAQVNAATMTTTPTFSGRTKEPKLKDPEVFKGNRATTMEFLLKCAAIFHTQPHTFHSDDLKIAYVTNLLAGEAYEWIKPILLMDVELRPSWFGTWDSFRTQFAKDFGDSDIKETSRQKLKKLTQTSSAITYATEFRKHSLYLKWGDEAFRQAYFDGLKYDVQDKLLSPQEFPDLNSLIDASIRWDNLLFQRRRGQPSNKGSSHATVTPRKSGFGSPSTYTPRTPVVNSSTPGPVPMDIDSFAPKGPLTPAERERRVKNNLCLYCGKPGHRASDCRLKQSRLGIKTLEISAKEQPQQK